MSLYLLESPSALTELLYKKSEFFSEEHMLLKHPLFHFFEINFHFKLDFYVIRFLLLVSLAWDHSNKLIIKISWVNSMALMNTVLSQSAKNSSEVFDENRPFDSLLLHFLPLYEQALLHYGVFALNEKSGHAQKMSSSDSRGFSSWWKAYLFHSDEEKINYSRRLK